MPTTADTALSPALERSMDFFKALAHVQRLRIVGLLAGRPAVVEEIAAALGLSAATVSHHLRILRQAGLLSVKATSSTGSTDSRSGACARPPASCCAWTTCARAPARSRRTSTRAR
jgi:predicted transcriptional regulator